jgi:hypothetical protein
VQKIGRHLPHDSKNAIWKMFGSFIGKVPYFGFVMMNGLAENSDANCKNTLSGHQHCRKPIMPYFFGGKFVLRQHMYRLVEQR